MGRDSPIASRADEIAALLETMQLRAPDIEASALVSVEGLLMASALPRGLDEDTISAMSAAMVTLGSRIVSELDRGQLGQVFLDGGKGTAVLTAVREEAVLTVLVRPNAQLGLVLVSMRDTASRLAELLYSEQA